MESNANLFHAGAMNEILALLGLVALAVIGLLLARLVRCDGLGTVSAPRSHSADLGTWVERELRR
jgi:hypothetical protein